MVKVKFNKCVKDRKFGINLTNKFGKEYGIIPRHDRRVLIQSSCVDWWNSIWRNASLYQLPLKDLVLNPNRNRDSDEQSGSVKWEIVYMSFVRWTYWWILKTNLEHRHWATSENLPQPSVHWKLVICHSHVNFIQLIHARSIRVGLHIDTSQFIRLFW